MVSKVIASKEDLSYPEQKDVEEEDDEEDEAEEDADEQAAEKDKEESTIEFQATSTGIFASTTVNVKVKQ